MMCCCGGRHHGCTPRQTWTTARRRHGMARGAVQFGHQEQSAGDEMLVGVFGQIELVEVEDVGVVDGLCLQRVRVSGKRAEERGEQKMTNDEWRMTKE